jgi:guanine deaminase
MDFLHEAYLEALTNMNRKTRAGGPFGAVITRDGQIVAKAKNRVSAKPEYDPTAHAEIVAIRMAAKELKTKDLAGCEIYTTCFPCVMCLGAIFWAGIRKVIYGCSSDFAASRFDDRELYKVASTVPIEHLEEVTISGQNKITFIHVPSIECKTLITNWEGTRG